MRKIIWFSMMAVLLFLFGCTVQTGTPIKAEPFLGGDIGLAVAFSADSPPSEVDDGGQFPFDVVVELRNMGENDVAREDAQVRIIGVRPEEFSKTEADLTKHPDEDIIATQKDPEGAVIESPTVFVTFSGFNHKESLVGNKDFTLRAEACYLYKTQAMAQLCIRRNNINPETGGICEVSEEKPIYNSGAPVQATSFKEFGRAKERIGFQFAVEHVGNGDLFEKHSECNTERKYEDMVFVQVKTEFGSGLKCSGLSEGDDTSGFVKLYGGKRVVSCTQEVDTTSDYETPVVVTLNYDYRDDVQTSIIVKHIPEES